MDAKFTLTEADPRAIQPARGDHPFHAAFPDTPATLARYDLLLLGDVPADSFSRKQQEMIRDFVNAGGGLIHIAGRGRGTLSWADTPLGDVLPVEFDVAAKGPEAGNLTAGFRPVPAPLGSTSEFLKLRDGSTENERLCAELPELYWHAPVKKLKPASVVYLVHPTKTTDDKKPTPLLASHAYGSGYVLFVDIDETWRWRYNVGDQHFGRFWSQAARVAFPQRSGHQPAR